MSRPPDSSDRQQADVNPQGSLYAGTEPIGRRDEELLAGFGER